MRQVLDGDLMYDHAGSMDVSDERRQAKQNLRKRVWDMVRRLPPDAYTKQVEFSMNAILEQDELEIDREPNFENMISSGAENFLGEVEDEVLSDIPVSLETSGMLRAIAQTKRDIQIWVDAHGSQIPRDEAVLCKRFSGLLSEIEVSITKIDRAHTLLERRKFALGGEALRSGLERYGSVMRRYEGMRLSKQNHIPSGMMKSLLVGEDIGDGVERFVYLLRRKAEMLLSDALYRLERIESSEQE